MMAATAGEDERVVSAEASTLRQSIAPDDVVDGTVNGLAAAGEGREGPAEALKKAARAGVVERWERVDDRCMYGCVDWYLYPEDRPTLHPGL